MCVSINFIKIFNRHDLEVHALYKWDAWIGYEFKIQIRIDSNYLWWKISDKE